MIVMYCRKHGKFLGIDEIRNHIYESHSGIASLIKRKKKTFDFMPFLSNFPNEFAFSYGD